MTRPHGSANSLFLGIPAHDGRLEVAFTCGLLGVFMAARQRGLPVHAYFNSGESLISRARNNIAKVFLEMICPDTGEPYTHMLMIDTDLGFSPDQVFALLAAADDAHGIVAGMAPLKKLDWDRIASAAAAGVPAAELARHGTKKVVNLLDGHDYEADSGDVIPVKYAGTGFMMITRKALLDWAAFHPNRKYMPDYTIGSEAFDLAADKSVTAFFDTMICPDEGRYLSEDYYFCKMARAAGIETYVHRHVLVSHAGKFTYELAGA